MQETRSSLLEKDTGHHDQILVEEDGDCLD